MGGSSPRIVLWALFISLAAMLGHDASIANAQTPEPHRTVTGNPIVGQAVLWRLDHVGGVRTSGIAVVKLDVSSFPLRRQDRNLSRDIECDGGMDLHVAKGVILQRSDIPSPSGGIIGQGATVMIDAVEGWRAPPTGSPQMLRALIQLYRI